MAQAPTAMCKGMYFQQQSFFLASPLSVNLASVLGPVIDTVEQLNLEDSLKRHDPIPMQKRKRDLWLTPGIFIGPAMNQPQWTAVTV